MRTCLILAALVCTCTALSRGGIWLSMLRGRQANENIPQLAVSLGENKLVDLVKMAGLAPTLSLMVPPAPFTLFGPTNDALAAIPEDVRNALMNNNTLLKEFLSYHVVSGQVFSSQLKNDLTAKSLLNSAPIRINIYNKPTGNVVTAQGSPVILVDQNATNGVIHELSRVMFPPMGTVVDVVANNPDFSTLLTAVTTAGLQDVLAGAGPFTVFAPTNAAFAKLPPGTLDDLLNNKEKLTYYLTYHVVPGTFYSAGLDNGMQVTALNKAMFIVQVTPDGVVIKTSKNMARVVVPDVSITNGVVHVIDEVLLPPDMILKYL